MKHTIAIGDVHGLTNWKDIVNDHKNEGCRFIFLGDYIDPYEDIHPDDLAKNLLDIINFKQKHNDDVILLLGNHDMHYINMQSPKGTRYDESIAVRISAIFEDHKLLFQYAYQEGKTIYTHAGISNAWWNDDFLPLIDKSSLQYTDGILDVASLLNNTNSQQLLAMFQVGFWRGGSHENGGIFWADKNETYDNPLQGFRQVVGHTRVPAIQTNSIDRDTQIIFCDCLSSGAYYSSLQYDNC